MRKFIIILLIGIILISSYLLIKELLQNRKQEMEFEELINIVEDAPIEIVENNNHEPTQEENKSTTLNIQELYDKNNDFVAWIKIDGTNINYPVMQNKYDSQYYLNRNFYKSYSSYGTPFLASNCRINSNNLIIYGHNIKNGAMFGGLENYKNKNYYNNHKFIKLYHIDKNEIIENMYEIVFVFKTVAYSDNGFKYNTYANFYSEEECKYFVEKCQELSLYSAGINIDYKDKLLMLSTCEYSNKNGRLVVVAKKM